MRYVIIPTVILNSLSQHYLQKVLWRVLLILMGFFFPLPTAARVITPCTAEFYEPSFLFVLSLLITFEFSQYSISRLTHPLLLFSIYFMLPTLSQPPPWDSSTPLPCSDSFWERWQLEQLQSSLIADAGQCPVPGQWHVEWKPPVPFSSLTCTPQGNYHLFKLQREPPYAVTGIETLGIHHKLIMSKSFKALKQNICCRYTELLHHLHLMCCVIKPSSYLIDLSLQ